MVKTASAIPNMNQLLIMNHLTERLLTRLIVVLNLYKAIPCVSKKIKKKKGEKAPTPKVFRSVGISC